MKKAFTLAEVLLTLVVIGIVASLTIPALIQHTQYAEFVVAMKKSMADFNQAAALIKIDNANSLNNAFGSSHNSFMQTFCNKMICVKQCLTGQTGCFYPAWKALDGANGWVNFSNRGSAVLNNGATVYFTYRSQTCTDTTFTINGKGALCGFITIDVNGFKPPNIAGRDIFIFAITTNGVIPNEVSNAGANYMSRCDSTQTLTNNGDFCAARIMKEGGINY